MTPSIEQILHKTFGYQKFRGQQRQIIEHLIADQDALVVMATGSGKSLCYQLPALVRDGVAVVISPLIALMTEQVAELEQLGISAACLNAGQDWRQEEEIEQQLKMGVLDILYLSPEKMMSPRILEQLHQVDIALFAIDEAHCIWSWGQYFRPEYQQLKLLATEFPRVPRIALTATASSACRQDIIKQLSLEKAKVFEDNIDRANLLYWIQPKKRANKQLMEFIEARHLSHSGIVYCQTRKQVEDVCQFLCQQNIVCESYHAGLESEQRWAVQQRFLHNKTLIIVATIAFGMGVNKPDVRFVAHMGLPRNIESYHQETGRAGRDGHPADVWMVFGLRDFQKLHHWISHGDLDAERQLWETEQLLDLMRYILEVSCRRQRLLSNFCHHDGLQNEQHQPQQSEDSQTIECQHCDNCYFPRTKTDLTELARQALSAVYRCGQTIGIDLLIKILRGKKVNSQTSDLSAMRYEQLSVFGIGKSYSVDEWRAVFWELLASRQLQLHGEYSELVKLSTVCKKLLKGEETLKVNALRYFLTSDYLTHKDREAYKQHALYQKLRQIRAQLAAKADVLEHQIMADRTLLQLTRHLPQTKSDLSQVDGVGEVRAEKYAEDLLKAIYDYTLEQQHQLDLVLSALSEPVNQTDIEEYAIEQGLTLQELATEFTEYIRLGLVKIERLLPIADLEIRNILTNWNFPPGNSGKIQAQKYYHDKYPAYWMPCLQTASNINRATSSG